MVSHRDLKKIPIESSLTIRHAKETDDLFFLAIANESAERDVDSRLAFSKIKPRSRATYVDLEDENLLCKS